MKQRKSVFFILILCCLCLSGCDAFKKNCDYCGELKYCTEYDLAGVTRQICEDCLSNPAIGSTSPTIMAEYGVILEEKPEETVSESSIDITNIEAVVIPGEEPEPVQQTVSTQDEKAALIRSINAFYENAGMEIRIKDDNENIYGLYSGDDYQKIQFIFTPVQEGMTPTVSVQGFAGASGSGGVAACIYAALSYVGSTDYSGLGYEIYNNATSKGSYITDDGKFYYTTFTETDIENGAPEFSFDVSK